MYKFIHSIVQIHVGEVHVDIQAEESLVLDLGILRNHEHILSAYQVGDDVLDFLGGLSGPLNGGSCLMRFELNLLHDPVDDLRLDHVLRAVVLEFLHHSHDHHRQLLVLVETDFHLSTGLVLGGIGRIYILNSGRVYLGNLFLVFSLLLFSLISVKFILNVCIKFNIILLDVDVRLLQKSAHLPHVGHRDRGRAVNPGESL